MQIIANLSYRLAMNQTDPALEHFKNYLNTLITIHADQWDFFKSKLQLLELAKDEYFFRQGERPTHIGFTLSGLLVNYYTDSKGDEYVKKFSSAGSPIACYGSLIHKRDANYSAKALEPTVLFTLKYATFLECYDRHPCWERLGRLIAEKLYLEKEFREESFLVADAKERYAHFCKYYPDLVQKVPQYLIASYIGITPVSLSRLKKE